MKENKPIIGIDGNEANLANRVGVNVYASEVINGIAKLEGEWKDRVRVVVYLKDKPLPHMPKPTENFTYSVLHGKGLWIIRTLMPNLYTSSPRPSVFWTPSHYSPLFSPMPTVSSIMDLGYLEFSTQFKNYDFWQLKLWTAWSIKKARKVLAISEATKKDVVKYYPDAREKTVVTLLGYDDAIYNTKISAKEKKRVVDKYSMGQDYVLFMSTLKPSKNVEGLLKAWALIEKNHQDIKLVVAGKKGWMFENIFELTKKLSLEERVVFTDFVDEADKPAIIAGAKVFVLPSYWEGFGIDVVSAMACGVPVVVSDRGSLTEVAGEAGIVVNPDSSEEIAHAVDKILVCSKKEHDSFVSKGLEQAKKFNWLKTARQTLGVLLGIINQ